MIYDIVFCHYIAMILSKLQHNFEYYIVVVRELIYEHKNIASDVFSFFFLIDKDGKCYYKVYRIFDDAPLLSPPHESHK